MSVLPSDVHPSGIGFYRPARDALYTFLITLGYRMTPGRSIAELTRSKPQSWPRRLVL